MTYSLILFDDDFKFPESEMKEVAKSAIKKIYDELPEDARRIDVIKDVLNYAKESLETAKITL